MPVAKTRQHQFSEDRIFSERQFKKLLACINHFKGKEQDHSLFSLLAYTGLRISEVCDLDWEDIDFDEGRLKVKNGKGSKARIVYFGRNVLSALKMITQKDSGAIFIGQRGRLTPSGVRIRFRKYRDIAKLPPALTVHSLRHRYACYLLNSGINLSTIKDMLGHSSLSITSLYLHMQQENITKLQNIS